MSGDCCFIVFRSAIRVIADAGPQYRPATLPAE
jgi:hypothetical protein